MRSYRTDDAEMDSIISSAFTIATEVWEDCELGWLNSNGWADYSGLHAMLNLVSALMLENALRSTGRGITEELSRLNVSLQQIDETIDAK